MTEPTDRPALDASDEALLRAFEPVVRYTRGESFLPMSVTTYLASAAHVRRRVDGTIETTGAGSVKPEALVSGGSGPPIQSEYLTVAGVEEADYVGDLLRGGNQAVGFRSSAGRLARVGYTSRLVDALFSLSLLARGRVPGSLARRAVKRYRELAKEDPRHPYYGRVARTATWTVLQYWFFYAFNDWRSGFRGANDHEADWEQILVYLDRDESGRAVPVWAAYAQHDYHGQDLRRRWDDDRQLELVGDHPVAYAGAGSHASYFRPGEYLAEQELRLPGAVRSLVNAFVRLMDSGRSSAAERIIPIAFVDYARGDGDAIGPGCARSWTPVVLDDQPWLSGFSGLWGLSVQDPFRGEDAPAGPMYNRDGTLRKSWTDPVAFAGLDATAPPSQESELIAGQLAAAEHRQAALADRIPVLEREIAAAGSESLVGTAATSAPRDGPEAPGPRDELARLHVEREHNALRIGGLRAQLRRMGAGFRDDPQAHLRRMPNPTDPNSAKAGALLEVWAAVSIGLLLLALVAALVLAPEFGVVTAVVVIAAFVFVESLLRRRVVGMLATWTRILALVAAAVLAVNFWPVILIGAAIAAGLFVIWENLDEFVISNRKDA